VAQLAHLNSPVVSSKIGVSTDTGEIWYDVTCARCGYVGQTVDDPAPLRKEHLATAHAVGK